MGRTSRLLELIKQLSNNIIIFDVNPEEKTAEYLAILGELTSHRIDYSVLTHYVLGQENTKSRHEEKFEIIEINIDFLIAKVEGDPKYNRIENTLYKIKDHIRLSLIQKKFIEDYPKRQIEGHLSKIAIANMDLTKQIQDLKNEFYEVKSGHKRLLNEHYEVIKDHNKIKKEQKEFEEKHIKYDKEHKELSEKYNQIFTQFVAVLGIFAAIIFGAFGGVEVLGNVMNNIGEVRIAKLIIFSSLLIASVLLILYLLLNGIANITGKNLRSCGCDKGSNCRHTMFQKHPIFITGMIFSFYLFTVGVLARGFNTTDLSGIWLIDNIMKKGSSLLIISVLGLALIMLTVYFMNKRKET